MQRLLTYLALTFLIFLSFIITGCAASDVARDATNNIELGVENAKNLVSGDTDFANRYANTSQATKGALIGGTAGLLTGTFAGSILPFTVTGALLGASYGAYIDSKTNRRDILENRGVTIVVLGDQILIVLRSAQLFYPMTAELKPGSYSTLQLVSQYINQYTKMLVKVAAYTNDTGSERANMALSEQQAHSVAKILSAYGTDARLLYSEGYGGTHLVTKNTLDWDSNDNYRIEITLEKLYV